MIVRLHGGPHDGLELDVPNEEARIELGRTLELPGLQIVDTEPEDPDFRDIYERGTDGVFRFVETR